jgi:hypothetical protein
MTNLGFTGHGPDKIVSVDVRRRRIVQPPRWIGSARKIKSRRARSGNRSVAARVAACGRDREKDSRLTILTCRNCIRAQQVRSMSM